MNEPPTDYRKTRRQQDRAMILLVIGVLLVGGTALIGLIWGMQAAITGGMCLFGGAALVGGLWLLMGLLEWFVED